MSDTVVGKPLQSGTEVGVLLDAPNFLPDSGFKHVATSYELSFSPDFETTANSIRDEDAIIVSNIYDEKNLTSFYYIIENLDEEDIIYARTKIHYTEVDNITGELNEYDTGWSEPTDIHSNQEGFKITNVIIATPRLHLTDDYTGNQNGDLIITADPMEIFLGHGNHKSTTWLIETLDGKEVLKIEKAEDMLTELKIYLDNFDKNICYIIKCIFYSDTGAKSRPGKYLYINSIYKSDLYELLVKGDLIVNRKLSCELILNMPKFISVDLQIKDRNNNIKAFAYGQKTTYPEIFPANLIPNETYYLYSRIEYEHDQYTEWRLVKILRAKGNLFADIDRFAKYKESYTYMHPIMQYGCKHLRSRELYQGGFILPRSTPDSDNIKGLGYYKIEGDNLLYVKDLEYLGEEVNSDNMLSHWGVDVLPLNNGKVVVSYTRFKAPDNEKIIDPKNNTIMFDVYEVNEGNNTFKKIKHKVADNHFKSTAISGSACSILNDIYYIPSEMKYGDNKLELRLFKFDTETTEITELTNLPFKAHRYVSICKIDDTKILIIGGVDTDIENNDLDYHRTNNIIYVYDVATKRFDELMILDAVPTKIYNFHAVLRKDAKVILFNNTDIAGRCEDQSTIILDIENKTYKMLKNDFKDNRPYLKTLDCKNGNILRISSYEYQPQMIYSYDIYGYTTVSKNGEVVGNVITDLVVPENTTIAVDNLYRYSSITILGDIENGTSGTLIWNDEGTNRIFKSDTKFINKDVMYYEDTQDMLTNDPKINEIFVLDNVTIHVKDILAPKEEILIDKEETIIDTAPDLRTPESIKEEILKERENVETITE